MTAGLSVGDGLAVVGMCLLLAVVLVAAAWVGVTDRRERFRAAERLDPATWTTKTTTTKRAAR